jgi:hypothetical protein
MKEAKPYGSCVVISAERRIGSRVFRDVPPSCSRTGR